jgi:hypothetical protein
MEKRKKTDSSRDYIKMEKRKKTDSSRDYISWNDDMDKVLINTFVESTTRVTDAKIGENLMSIRQLSKPLGRSAMWMSPKRTSCTIISGMLGSSGFGWDCNKNRISADSKSIHR